MYMFFAAPLSYWISFFPTHGSPQLLMMDFESLFGGSSRGVHLPLTENWSSPIWEKLFSSTEQAALGGTRMEP